MADLRPRAAEGMILPKDDTRVKAAMGAMQWAYKGVIYEELVKLGVELTWEDAAEIVNAVLAADDELAAQLATYVTEEDGY